MKKIQFFGYSDDLVYYKIDDREEEINTQKAYIGLVSKEGMMVAIVKYGDIGSTWSVTPMIWGEGEEFPDWPIHFDVIPDPINDDPYSMRMTVEAPDDTKIVQLGKN